MNRRETQPPAALIALLGNPGRAYDRTRHNVARRLLPVIEAGATLAWREKFHGRVARWGSAQLLVPATFMNESGRSVQAAAAFFGAARPAIVVVHDDLETPFGEVRLVDGGGHRGNNGVRSVARALGGDDFRRLRIGVGRPPATWQVSDWVLAKFSEQEEAELEAVIERAVRLVAPLVGVA